MVAEDQARFILYAHATATAPYDGGMDILMPDEESRDDMRMRCALWLSPREDGL